MFKGTLEFAEERHEDVYLIYNSNLRIAEFRRIVDGNDDAARPVLRVESVTLNMDAEVVRFIGFLKESVEVGHDQFIRVDGVFTMEEG